MQYTSTIVDVSLGPKVHICISSRGEIGSKVLSCHFVMSQTYFYADLFQNSRQSYYQKRKNPFTTKGLVNNTGNNLFRVKNELARNFIVG